MQQLKINLSSLISSAIAAGFALYCTLRVMVRTDDAAELSLKRTNAVLLTLLWPLSFSLFLSAYGVEKRRIALWTILVLFLPWLVGASSMQMEYSRGGNDFGVLGF